MVSTAVGRGVCGWGRPHGRGRRKRSTRGGPREGPCRSRARRNPEPGRNNDAFSATGRCPAELRRQPGEPRTKPGRGSRGEGGGAGGSAAALAVALAVAGGALAGALAKASGEGLRGRSLGRPRVGPESTFEKLKNKVLGGQK